MKNIDQLKTTWAGKTLGFLQILASQHFLSQVPPTFHPCFTLNGCENDDDAMKCSWHFVPWSSFGSFKTKDRIVCRKNWGGGFKRSKFYPSSVFCKKKNTLRHFLVRDQSSRSIFFAYWKRFWSKIFTAAKFQLNFFCSFQFIVEFQVGGSGA